MNTLQLIKDQIIASINTKQAVLETLTPQIEAAGLLMRTTLLQGNKILCCGNGGSASDAQHFSAELLGRYVQERAALPAIALNTDTSTLTAIANDYGYDQVFARQIQALAKKHDLLLAISTSGNSANILKAIESAKQHDMRVIALTGKKGGKLATYLQSSDIHICIPADVTSRIQEAHNMILHCLCELIDIK